MFLRLSLARDIAATICLAVLLCLPFQAAHAQKSGFPEAEKFITEMADRTLEFVGDESMSLTEKKAAFRNMLDDHFSLDTIGRFALGRYWRVATPEQKKRYQHLFREMVIEVYSDRFEDYEGQDFDVRSSRAEGRNDVLVTSYIIPGDEPDVRVDWRVREKNNKYRIVDVVVEDVSMLMTKRSDFSSIIQRGGGNVGVLIEHLEKYEN